MNSLASRPALALLLALAACSTPEVARERGPNIVLFVVDDLGWQDASLALAPERTPFNERYRTPHLEALAARGVSFTNAYAASPVCTPTRTSILTGQLPARTRITNWTLEGDMSTQHATLAAPDWNYNGLSDDPNLDHSWCTATLPALLVDAGYTTIHIGKAHFGARHQPGADPTRLGFEINLAGHAAGGPGSFLGTQNYSAAWRSGSEVWDVPDLEAYHGTDTFLTEALTLEAERVVDQALSSGKPFFLHLAHYAVHVPFARDERLIATYEQAGLDQLEAQYAAMVEGVDHSLGRILARLAERGELENTVVIYVSDNGGLSAYGRGGEPHTHNAPLRSGKGSAYEGGVRVPLVIAGPLVADAQRGSRSDYIALTTDLFPTTLAAAGLDALLWEGRDDLDGEDLGPVLHGRRRHPTRPILWHYPHQWGAAGPGIEPYSALRRGRWKLIHFYADGRRELYDLAADLGEQHDVAQAQPQVADELERRLGEHLQAAGAQTPIIKSSGISCPFPGQS